MKDLDINDDTTLYLPDEHGNVEIELFDKELGYIRGAVPFKKLQPWVASIQEQIITSSNEQAKGCIMYSDCRYARLPDCNDQCRHKPPVG